MTKNPPATPLLQGWLILLGALIALGPLSIDMYLPGLPTIGRDLAAPPGSVELTLASYFIGMSIGQLFYGPISDRFGRKKPLYAGLILYTLATVGCLLATDVYTLTAWRFVQALGGCAGMVIARAVVRDRCQAREAARAFSALILVMGLAPILAPLLGGWIIAVANWQTIFALLALFSLLCLVMVYIGLAETHDTRHAEPLQLGRVLRTYGQLLQNRAFLGYATSGSLAMAGMFVYIAGSPFVLIELYDIPQQHFGWVFGTNALGFIVASQLNARQLRYLAPTALLRRALWVPALAGLALVLLLYATTAPLAVLLPTLFLFVASLGYVVPNSSAAALATHGQHAGTASALLGTLQFGFATLAGTLVSLWHDGSGRPLATLMALCGISALLVHRRLIPAQTPYSD